MSPNTISLYGTNRLVAQMKVYNFLFELSTEFCIYCRQFFFLQRVNSAIIRYIVSSYVERILAQITVPQEGQCSTEMITVLG